MNGPWTGFRGAGRAALVGCAVTLHAGCGSGDGAVDAAGSDDAAELPVDEGTAEDADESADEVATDVPEATDDSGGPCPPQMALVDGSFCIDLYEGALEELNLDGEWVAAEPYFTVGERIVRAVPAAGLYPQGYISGVEARAACERSGKRLCRSEEWLAACQGPALLTWPYGNEHIDGACNDHYAGGHPVVDFFGTSDGVWDMVHMNDPGINQQSGTIARGGEFPACVGSWGAFDLHGNLHEWVADTEGTFRGGFYADASINGPGCLYRTTAHELGYHDYSTGFRCCADI